MTKFKRVLLLSLASLGLVALAPYSAHGSIITKPWLQNIYTNRVTIMCETSGMMPGLSVNMGPQTIPMTCVEGLKEGTYVYSAQCSLVPGARANFILATNGVEIGGMRCRVIGWDDEDSAFSVAIWGDNQEGTHPYDWGNDVSSNRYAAVRSMFNHMKRLSPDFGFSTGDFSSNALYDDEIEPGELRAADDLFGRTIPYHLVWGNHDCNGSFFGEVYTNAAQRYFSPAATEDEGWFYLYRNDVLFIGVHWTWGQDNAEARYAAIAQGIEDLLKTDRAKNAKFRVLVQHAPIFLECYNVLPKANWFSDTRLLDVAKAGGIDLVLSGHTHAYERIERDGLVQIVNGGMGYLDHGERWYNNYGSDTKVGGHQNTPFLWARQDASGNLDASQSVRMGCFQGYGMLSVTNNTLTYQAHAFDANGNYIGVADTLTLTSKRGETQSEAAVAPFTPSTALASPVNNKNWQEFKTSQGESWTCPDGTTDTDPVVNVSKTEIERFCAALNAGKTTNYRLPTVKELAAIFDGNLKRDVSEWTCDVDPSSGWCRILGGNAIAVDYTWCREYDQPAISTPDCHANYLGFRVIDAAKESNEMVMDRALAALAKIPVSEQAAVYVWKPMKSTFNDISSDWANGTISATYGSPVIFTGKGDLKYDINKDVEFGGGLAVPNATSIDFSHAIGSSYKITVKGEFRGGVATNEWKFFIKADELCLKNVLYRGQVFNAVTDSRTLNLAGTNDFSGAVMSVGVDNKLLDPNELFVTNLVNNEDQPAALKLRRLDFTARGVVGEVLGQSTAGFTVGTNVALIATDDVLFALKGATLTVNGALDAAGIDIAGHLMGLLPQEATVNGSGYLTTTHFGMCDNSTLNLDLPWVVLLSSVPYRTYSDPSSGCNVNWIRKPIKSDNLPAVLGETIEIEINGHKILIDYCPVSYASSSDDVNVVYTIDDDVPGYLPNGKRSVSFKMKLDPSINAWVVDATPAVIAAAITIIGENYVISYDAMGGSWRNGRAVSNVTSFIGRGYSFPDADPSRYGYRFDGWYRSWTNGAESVAETNITLSPVSPRSPHTLWAKWVRLSTIPVGDFALPDISSGQPVLEIAPGAFAQKTHPWQCFESFSTPVYLREIGDNAFQGVTSLRKLTIVQPRDYANASNRVSLAIGKQAFASCSSLEEICFQAGVTNLGLAAFMNCAKLKRIVFAGTNTISYAAKALYRCGYENGTGELKVYMRNTFKDNNPTLIDALRSWNTTLQIVPVVDAFPASGTPSIINFDISTLGSDGTVALSVEIPTDIPIDFAEPQYIPPDLDRLGVSCSSSLDGPWTTLTPVSVIPMEDGTVLFEVKPPDGAAGFIKVEVKDEVK